MKLSTASGVDLKDSGCSEHSTANEGELSADADSEKDAGSAEGTEHQGTRNASFVFHRPPFGLLRGIQKPSQILIPLILAFEKSVCFLASYCMIH